MDEKELKEFIEEVSKLLKYTCEIEMATKYKGIDKPNFQFIRTTVVNFKKLWE